MSKIHNVTINPNMGATSRLESKNLDEKSNGNKTISGADMSFTPNSIAEKRNQAREKAIKVLGDVFSKDTSKDDEFRMRRSHIEDMKRQSTEAKSIVNDVNKKLADLQEEYGVESDSTEQKDLELLEKRVESERDNSHIRFTKEEKERLAELDKKGYTEYQERAVRVYELGSVYNEKASDLDRQIDGEVKGLQAAKLDRLKVHEMVDADKDADKIMDAANKEVISSYIEEVKDKIEEKTEEEKEKSEEKEEEQEKIEELINKDDEKKKDDITEDIPLDEVQDNISLKQEMDKIIKDTGLSQEDMLGLSVDTEA